MSTRIKTIGAVKTISVSDMTDEVFIRELSYLSGCSFKPYRIVKVDGVSFSDATNGIEPKNMHIHFSSYMFHYYAFLKNKDDYVILKNNVAKEKLRL